MRFNLAIAVTLSRMLMAPVFAFAFIHSGASAHPAVWLWFAAAVLSLIELSDTLDGRIARARGEVSDFGKLSDPLADSVSRQTIFLSFCITHIIPVWLFLIFLYRDAIMSTLRIVIAFHGTVQAAKKSGKIKAVLQGIGSFAVIAVCLLIAYHVPGVPTSIGGRHPGFWIMLIPAFVTILSAFDYIVPNWERVRYMMRPLSNKPSADGKAGGA
jgi:CDP-diacylglycerol--glycerol-3-phosphate 3-phosphatidyltransferase